MTDALPEVHEGLQALLLLLDNDIAVSNLLAVRADLALPPLSLLLDDVRVVTKLEEELLEGCTLELELLDLQMLLLDGARLFD